MIREEDRNEGGMKQVQAQQQVFEGLLCPLAEASEGLPDPVAIIRASSQILGFCREALPAHMGPV